MKINTKPMEECISKLLSEPHTPAQETALRRIQQIVYNAKQTANRYPVQSSLTYGESLNTSLAEALSPLQKQELSKVGIKPYRAPGAMSHKLNLLFHHNA